jgi:protein-disulfide isomerase
MRRFALPLIILGVTLILILLIAVGGGSSGTDYNSGKATEQPISEDWVRGNPAAKVVLIEYSDFQCPACKAYEPLLRQAESLFESNVAFVYRHFPLTQLHANADLAARASEAAGKQGKFWEMHDALFDHHDSWENMLNAESTFLGYAQQIGLNLDQFKSDLTSSEVKQAAADDYARGVRAGVQGTPSFILNGKLLTQNPQNLAEFKLLLDTALAQQ